MKKKNLGVIILVVIVVIVVVLFVYETFIKKDGDEHKVGSVTITFDEDDFIEEETEDSEVLDDNTDTFGYDEVENEIEHEEEQPYVYPENNYGNDIGEDTENTEGTEEEYYEEPDEQLAGEEFVTAIRSFLMNDSVENYRDYFDDNFYSENVGKLTISYKNYLYADNELHNPVMKVIPFNADDEHYYNVMYTLNAEGKVNSITIVEADSSIWGGYHIDSNGKIIYD